MAAPIDETNCPVKYALDLVGGKWKPIILYYLKDGAARFGELRRLIPHVSHKVLTQQLRQLESDGIIQRRAFDGKIKHVEYLYSDEGATIAPVLAALAEWGARHRNA